MLGRFATLIRKAIPLSAIMTSFLFNTVTPRMTDHPSPSIVANQTINLFRNSNPRIKHVRDLGDYIQKILPPGVSIILFELTGDSHIDAQVIQLAEAFANNHSNDISTDYQFIFLDPSPTLQRDEQNYLIVYSPNGQKIINIDSYLNKNKEKGNIKLNTKPLMKRLIQSLNTYKEVGLDNIASEFKSLNSDNHYTALLTTARVNYRTKDARKNLEKMEKQYTTKNKFLRKFVIKDEQTRNIFGIKQNEQQKIYLIVGDSNNLKKQYRQKASFFKINGKKYTKIDVHSANLNQIFVFPPIQKSISPEQFVLNVYLNKNTNHEPIQQQIYEQLSKPEYANLPKAIYYTNDVEQAAIFYEQNDYTKLSLTAYQSKSNIVSKDTIKHLLTHTFQYQYKLKANDSIDSSKLQRWIEDCKNHKNQQHFPSQKPENVWAQQITGQQYKSIRSQDFDKVIYHYSHHCHGCKKFGGNYEQFAKNRHEKHPNIHFYRINNDYNKCQGVKNFNSTPVFVFFKKGYNFPFIYKVPFFTDALFDAFLKITSQVKLVPMSEFESQLKSRRQAEHSIRQLIGQVKG